MKVCNSSDRIKELMSIYNMNQAEFVEKTGLTKSIVSLYVNGKREPMQNNIYIISHAFGVDPAWLMGCDVPMVNEKYNKTQFENKYDVENARLLNIVKNDEQVLGFVKKYINLPDDKKNVVKMLVDSLSDNR